MKTAPYTLQHAIYDKQRRHKATGALTDLLTDLAVAAKIISNKVRQAGLLDILGAADKSNFSGDSVQKLDLFANEVIKEIMYRNGHVAAMASEEDDEMIVCPEAEDAKYVLLFDPLDGSSNIDCNVGIGTIFAIHQRTSADGPATLADILQPGARQITAGYIVYGTSTMFIYTTGEGVDGFTLDPSLGEFVLSHPQMKIPTKGKIYSINEGNQNRWQAPVKAYIDHLKLEDKTTGRPYTSRYIGSMVADVHRSLVYGGVFMYPGDSKNPHGKLRILYEAAPMSMIIEQAGGLAISGEKRILEIQPSGLHERTPLFLGSPDDIKKLAEFLGVKI